MIRRAGIILGLLLLAGCTSASEEQTSGASDDGSFPYDGETQGKEDAFGRSLVGLPSPFEPDPGLLADPVSAENELKTNMRLRRQTAWETTRKALEPVPLLGLANQLEARPSCPDGVSNRSLDRCDRQSEEEACANFTADGVAGICEWDETSGSCAPACDNLMLPDGEEIPKIPRWQTWYGLEDINRIFKYAYDQLDEEEQLARTPFSDTLIGRAFNANLSAVERSSRWPLRRYTDAVLEIFGCELERGTEESEEDYARRCGAARQSQFSGASAAGGGISRMMYSPAMALHMMRNYGEVLDCRDDVLEETWCEDGEPCADPGENFSTCFRTEFPADAGNPWQDADPEEEPLVAGLPGVGGTAIIKATWSRVGFGFKLPAFDTDGDSLSDLIGPGQLARWGDEGDRVYESPPTADDAAFPGPRDIYTIKTKSGSVYRLTGLHIMTKELRHWQWISLWWSDKPDEDFGEDRPDSFSSLPGVWSNYKMCVVVDYTESDPDVLSRFQDMPGLQAALAATEPEAGAPTWCSNPYIEHGAGNARTNCIGCHQHAGTRFEESFGDQLAPFDLEKVIARDGTELTGANRYPANGRLRRRTHFAADYSWAFSRLDDLTELIRTEVEFKGAQTEQWARMKTILESEGSTEAGEGVFRTTTDAQSCADCHGESGEGGFGPNLEQRFTQKTDWQLLYTILNGRGSMPAWKDTLSDEELTDLFAYLRASFATR